MSIQIQELLKCGLQIRKLGNGTQCCGSGIHLFLDFKDPGSGIYFPDPGSNWIKLKRDNEVLHKIIGTFHFKLTTQF
jgi:hypothetical protein